MKMRQMLIIAIAALFVACESKEEKLIKDYEQTILGTKVDLDIKITSMEETEEITASDSLTFFESKIDDIEDIDEMYANAVGFLKDYESWLPETQKTMEGEFKSINNIKLILDGIKKYKPMGDQVLAHKYKTVFTANNPLLGKQTIGSFYYLSPDKSKILRSERYDL